MWRRKMRFLKCCTISVSLVILLAWLKPGAPDERLVEITNIVLIGGTGDLAKKYLWQGFFHLYTDVTLEQQVMRLYGAARTDIGTGSHELKDIMSNHVTCSDSSLSECETLLGDYRKATEYVQLKTVANYRDLCDTLNNQVASGNMRERGRLFYLSVPPFAYSGIVKNINTVCRPTDDRTWLRVVLEKPFGRDLKSAKELAEILQTHLKEKEIYRIDHYLGKPGVRAILPFRIHNHQEYNRLWNGDHIAYVEIAMKETIDVKGRLGFYDSYGVIRDVMQNHLMEVMNLVAMEIPGDQSNSQHLYQHKLQFLKDVEEISSNQLVIGQYEGYADQWKEEVSKGSFNISRTPTFAASSVFVHNSRWAGVPFILMAGKKLKEKLSYVKISFRGNTVCPTSVMNDDQNSCKQRKIIFVLSQSDSKLPSILVSKSLPKPNLPDKLFVRRNEYHNSDTKILGEPLSNYYQYDSLQNDDAYSMLIQDCFRGNKASFVGTKDLMATWRIWSKAVSDIDREMPRLYSYDTADEGLLDFEIVGKELNFIYAIQKFKEKKLTEPIVTVTISDTYRKKPLVVKSTSRLMQSLALQILWSAKASIEDHGSFHIAFSGGSSPLRLYSLLATRYRESFPWRLTHVWMVDERCIDQTSNLSNFKQLHDSLLQFTSLPHYNIHPMPIQSLNGPCNIIDKGPQLYAAEMDRTIHNGRLDYILLGVGSDGHTASLFPQSKSLNETYHKVLLTENGPKDQSPERMTLSYYTINSARNIGVLITGSAKHKIVEKLRDADEGNYGDFPILGVKPVNGTLEWFIDQDAAGG